MRPSSVFNAARIRSIEPKLLNNEKVGKLLAAADVNEVFRLLGEHGFNTGDGFNEENFESVLKRDFHETCKLLREEMSSAEISELFFCGYDYHNAKVFFKTASSGEAAADAAVMDEGLIEYKKLSEYLRSKSYEFLPRAMREALRALERDASGDIAEKIGLAMDTAYSCDIEERLKSITDEFVKKYFRVLFDFSNVIMFIRMKRAGAPKRSFERSLLKCSSLNTLLLQSYDKEEKDIPSLFARTDYADELAEAYAYLSERGSYAMFQKKRDDALLALVSAHSKDIATDAPMIGYLAAKQREIKAVRTVIITKLYDIPADSIADIIPKQMN